MVEFGPPSRWRSAANDHTKDGVQLIEDMADEYSMEPRLIKSLVWQEFLGRASDGAKNHAKTHRFVPLVSSSRKQQLIDGMKACCEACASCPEASICCPVSHN